MKPTPEMISRGVAEAAERATPGLFDLLLSGPGRAFLAWGLGIAVGLATAGCGPSADPPSAPSAAPSTHASPSGTTNPAAAAPGAPADAPAADLAKVLGRWLRPDGGYILELRDLDAASGRLNAAYLNPQPIHVAQAEAKRESGKITVFVELQDANYPGCTYRLTYFPASDQLYGVYYQAALDQSFDVEFVRQK